MTGRCVHTFGDKNKQTQRKYEILKNIQMTVELYKRADNLNQTGARSVPALKQKSNPIEDLQTSMLQQFQHLSGQLKAEIRHGIDAKQGKTSEDVATTQPKYRTLDAFHREEPNQKYTRDSKGALVTSETRGDHVPELRTLTKPTIENGDIRKM